MIFYPQPLGVPEASSQTVGAGSRLEKLNIASERLLFFFVVHREAKMMRNNKNVLWIRSYEGK
jgi:hypothetical protein